MTKQEHNGWSSYETWLVKLWMDNEQSSADHWNETARACVENVTASKERGELGTFTTEECARLNLADVLKDQHEESLPQLDGFHADLMNAAMSEVNWQEIAKSLIEALEPATV